MSERIKRAVIEARAAGATPAHLALTKDDEREIGLGCVLYGGIAVKRAWKASRSHLWARRDDRLIPFAL